MDNWDKNGYKNGSNFGFILLGVYLFVSIVVFWRGWPRFLSEGVLFFVSGAYFFLSIGDCVIGGMWNLFYWVLIILFYSARILALIFSHQAYVDDADLRGYRNKRYKRDQAADDLEKARRQGDERVIKRAEDNALRTQNELEEYEEYLDGQESD